MEVSSDAPRLRALVWGAGAIGGVIGAHLVRAGHDLTFVDSNRAHVTATRAAGLRIVGPIADFTVRAPFTTPDSLEGCWDCILLAVKALDTDRAAAQLAPHLAPEGCVVSLQNGLNEALLADAVGAERTVGAFVNFGADVLEPGIIQFSGRGAVVLGELDGRGSARLDRLVGALRDFEPEARASDNIWGYLWGKMGYAAMLFAGALTDASIVETLADPSVQPVLMALAREVMDVAAAHGAHPVGFNGFDPAAFESGGDPSAVRASFDAMVAFNRRSAKSRSGAWRDLAVHHRKTEIDAQFLPVLRIADRHGVAVPHLQRLVTLMQDVEEERRPRAWANLAALEAQPEGSSA